MDATMIDEHLENIDRRLTTLEQILPTVATKDELKTLATKADLQSAIAPLATKEDIQELRRHMTILVEHQDSKLELLAKHLLKGKPSKE